MRKIIIVGLVIMLLISTATAAISIENSYELDGTGVMDHNIDAQTERLLDGQKYSASMRTPSLGLFGDSTLKYNEEINVLTGNESDIEVLGALLGNYTISKYCMRNYDIGAQQSLYTKGNTILDYEFMGDNYSSAMVVDGRTAGKTEYSILVRNVSAPHSIVFDENFEFSGLLSYNVESYIENITYPAEGCEDWLGCP